MIEAGGCASLLLTGSLLLFLRRGVGPLRFRGPWLRYRNIGGQGRLVLRLLLRQLRRDMPLAPRSHAPLTARSQGLIGPLRQRLLHARCQRLPVAMPGIGRRDQQDGRRQGQRQSAKSGKAQRCHRPETGPALQGCLGGGGVAIKIRYRPVTRRSPRGLPPASRRAAAVRAGTLRCACWRARAQPPPPRSIRKPRSRRGPPRPARRARPLHRR